MLNTWRNAIAHHDYNPADLGGTTRLAIARVADWRIDCDAFAIAFDAVLLTQLQTLIGAPPWPP